MKTVVSFLLAISCLACVAWAAPSVQMQSPDMVVRDGTLLRVSYSGFEQYPLVNVLLYDTANTTRRQLSLCSGPTGFCVFAVSDMAVSSAATVRVSPNDPARAGYYAELPYEFAIIYAPSNP